MQTVYATHLPLPDIEGGRGLDAAVGSVRRWTSRRFGVVIGSLEGGSASGAGASLRWELLLGEGGQGLFSLRVDQADQHAEDLRWRTHVDIGVEDGHLWLRVRVGLSSTREGFVVPPDVQVGRPGIVKDLIDELDVVVDGCLVGEVVSVDAERVDDHLALITDKSRHLPVVAVSLDERGRAFVSPERLSDRLLGMAHVAALTNEAAWSVTEAIGKELSCYNGAIRIYWPHFNVGDNRYHHRLYVGGVLDVLGSDGLVDEIFSVIGRTAGLSIDESSLHRELIRQKREADLDRRIEERADALARVEEAANHGKGATEEEFAAFSREFTELEERVGFLELEVLESSEEVATLRVERDAAARQVVEVTRALTSTTREPVLEAQGDEGPPRAVLEAVERAKRDARHTVYLQDALDSAASSEYADPVRVLEYLQLAEDVAGQWSAGTLQQGPAEEFGRLTAAFRSGVSATALQMYGEDYSKTHNEKEILLGPHFRRGTGAVAAILRIYMYFDKDTQQIVIGHVGRKLRDKSNRN